MNAPSPEAHAAPDAPPSTRRALLGQGLRSGLGLGLGLLLCTPAAAQTVCVDLDDLPSGQRAMRASLGFNMVSDDPKRHCRECSFYTAGAGECGRCTLFSGPVPADGRCDSWAQRK